MERYVATSARSSSVRLSRRLLGDGVAGLDLSVEVPLGGHPGVDGSPAGDSLEAAGAREEGDRADLLTMELAGDVDFGEDAGAVLEIIHDEALVKNLTLGESVWTKELDS